MTTKAIHVYETDKFQKKNLVKLIELLRSEYACAPSFAVPMGHPPYLIKLQLSLYAGSVGLEGITPSAHQFYT